MLVTKYSAPLVRRCFSAARKRFSLGLNHRTCVLSSANFSTQSERLTVSHAKGREEPVLNHTFGQVIEEAAEKFSDRLLVKSIEQGVQLTYSEGLRKADQLAAGLLNLGLQRGDRVALWAPNSWEWLITFLALARAGLISVAMNPLLVGDDVVHSLSLTKVAAVIAPEGHQKYRYHDTLVQLAPELRDAKPGSAKCSKFPYLRAAITLYGKTPEFAVGADELSNSASESDIAALRKAQSSINPEDAVLFQFSSGTTGKPKAVAVSHKGYANNGRLFGGTLSLSKDNKLPSICVQVPFFHAFGLLAVISCGVQIGAKIVVPSHGYSPEANLKALINEKCSIIGGTPTMYVDLLQHTETLRQNDLNIDVALVGGSPLLPQLAKDITSTLRPKRTQNIYGLSETTAICFTTLPGTDFEQTCNTVGQPASNVEVKVVDTKGNTVPVNTPGELWVRGYLRMIGYFDQPEATAKCVTEDGWVQTGDEFILDENGYGKIIGRFKDIIIRGGENISPTEVEKILVTHPAIIDAQVVGVKDDRLGEEVCACLLVREPITLSDIRPFCNGKISNFKIPRYYVVMDGYPKTTSGKIQKHKLRDACNRLLAENKLFDSKFGGSAETQKSG